MAVLTSATCSFCGAHLTGVGLRTGDEHGDARCTAPIVVDRAWSFTPSPRSPQDPLARPPSRGLVAPVGALPELYLN